MGICNGYVTITKPFHALSSSIRPCVNLKHSKNMVRPIATIFFFGGGGGGTKKVDFLNLPSYKNLIFYTF